METNGESRVKFVQLVFLSVFSLILAVSSAHAVLRVDITKGHADPLPIAIKDLEGDGRQLNTGGTVNDIGQNIARVVSADLERSGLFRTIDRAAFFREVPGSRPKFPNWRSIGAQALVTGQVSLQEDGRVKVEFRLWDVLASGQMIGLRYYTTPQNWRRIAHMMADAIYKRLTGESGYFDTRIVYVSESGLQTNRVKRLAIMDQDGYNHKFLTDGKHMALTPRFSPTAQEITYLSYFNDNPRVYLYNIDTGKQELLGDFPGMTFAPRFSPDGNKVIMSQAQKGNSDIYVMELRTRKVTRLTSHSAIDTSPSYSPDGRQITFNSDRGGSQQIYVMDANGKNIHRISFGKGRYGTPVWSPRGDLIAFTKIYQGRFYIGVMRPDGSGERLLTESFLDEGPTWSPNGRVLMFFRQQPYDKNGRGGETQVWSVDLTGYNERQIITPLDASDPAWSPLIR
ncbi:Tol-Pal system beta propeller repeat protein TolB [Emcibacter nanhaiensis]|uniref:Tol-Pal system protein TolB n=1 Tax=Emcibacter nanhaiensis TaxID=1505037 RepID=A0A501PPE9_9PROT|nr:Tol-Pal system protein TolB [Emcibacter nanhaiensis]